MQHASRIDSSSKNLVLTIIKHITEYNEDDDDQSPKHNSGNESPHNNNPLGALIYGYLNFVNFNVQHYLLM